MSAPAAQANAVALPRVFILHATIASVVLFGVIRLTWVDTHIINALIEFQKAIIFWYGARPSASIVVVSSCSGADVMALCLGVTLAYPVAWTRRLAGATVGLALILVLNALRIATLFAVADSPARLNLWHLYLWPAMLTLALALYVFAWIRWSERRGSDQVMAGRRFLLLTTGGLVLYAAVVPWVFASSALAAVSVVTATLGGAILAGMGAPVHVLGNTLFTSRGAFQVTPECLFTPVLPVYLAGVLSLPITRPWRLTWLALAAPVFFVLGVARLLALALPDFLVASPIFVAHGFYQFVAAAVLIAGAAIVGAERDAHQSRVRRTILGLTTAVIVTVLAGSIWSAGLLRAAALLHTVVPVTLTSLVAPGDQQGALAVMPAFQLGLLAGLAVALRRVRRRDRWSLAGALTVLLATQLLCLVAMGIALSRGWAIHPLLIRAWAVGWPVILAATGLAPGETRVGDAGYLQFWQQTGRTFPSLTGAASTDFYFENEKRLIRDALPQLAGRTVLKTDLWDEARNTRILQWVADQGSTVFGVDLSEPTVREARAAFGSRTLRPAVSDVRSLPFRDGSFDAIYSMGTIEHFAETEASVVELARVLKPGGRLILGVPNRHDPFLRPLMVAALYRFGLYDYGLEKSYSRRSLRRMLERAGLDVQFESGILFIPGWLRMADLWCHTRMPSLSVITRGLVAPFVWLDARVPALRRHGYLLASVAAKGPASVTVASSSAESIVDAHECDPAKLRSLSTLQALVDDVIGGLALRAVSPPVWHVFPGAGGITGMVLLAESHLTIHTFPETGYAAINLYCCRPLAGWDWDAYLRASLGAARVTTRVFRRG